MQMTILIVTLFGMLVIAAIFLKAVSAGTTAATEDTPPQDTDRMRMRLVLALLAGGVVVTFASLWQWPHSVSASSQTVSVNVTGGQWYWEIDKETLPAGRPIVFSVHTKDVNHGMGIYNAAGRLIVQIQGMPGYVNRVRHVFDQPGRYRVLCMEFCGLAHHDMVSEFVVSASGKEQ
ncbi:MAG: cytochrome c oxidase subunit 2 [Paracoccaceae bacterium]|jgi:cytochrome c oxidase subunit 2